MKKLNLSGDGIKGFFFNNGEKLLLGVTALVLLFFLYGAVTAKPIDDGKSPTAIVRKSTEKVDLIRAPSEPPKVDFPKTSIEEATKQTLLPLSPERANLLVSRIPWDRPVFQELRLRTDPEFYAVEDLKASAVVGIVPYLPPEVQPAAGAAAAPVAAPMAARPLQQRNIGHDDDYNTYVKKPPRLGGVAQPGGLGAGAAAAAAQPIVGAPAHGAHAISMDPQPKCMAVITGLLPVEKQAEAYRQTFEYALPSGQVELPVYQWFIVERTEVKDAADTNYNWQRVPDPADPKTTFFSKALSDIARWAVPTPELADPQYPCDPQTIVVPQAAATPLSVVTYMTWPLPPMYLRNWGPEAVHPKVPLFKPQEVAVQGPGNPAQGVDLDQAATMPNGAPAVNGAPNPALTPPRGQFANGVAADPLAPPPVPNKLFRFVDMTAKLGKTYRYRIQVALSNPNYINPLNSTNTLLVRHLAKPQQATVFSCYTPWSEPTPAVTMPRAYRLLAESVTGGRGAEPKAKIDVLTFVKTAAASAAGAMPAPAAPAAPGAAAPGVAAAPPAAPQVWLEVIKDMDLLLGSVANLPDVTFEKVFDPTIEMERKVEKVTISTNQSMLLDVRNEDALGANSKSKTSEMLFFEPDTGRLVALNSAADAAVRKDYKERTTPVQIPVDGGAIPAPGINPVPTPAVRPTPVPPVRPGTRVRGDG